MFDGKYRAWWCGSTGIGGDSIIYGEADSPSGPWTPGQMVFQYSNVPGTFDRVHTCDPSVIRVNGTYYMYYAGYDQYAVDPIMNRTGNVGGWLV